MKTKVIFKKFSEGDIIAIFPEMGKWDYKGNLVSYMHFGQHGGCSPELLNDLETAYFHEYEALYKELIDIIGYKLQVDQRII